MTQQRTRCPPGMDPILHAFGVDNLQKYGYIDYLDPQMSQPPDLSKIGQNRDYLRATRYVPGSALRRPIHPILKKDNFACPDAIYEMIRPALLIASGFLNEPALQSFLGGMLDQTKWIQRPGDDTKEFQELPSADMEQNPFSVWKKVALLKHCITFSFEAIDASERCHAMTGIFHHAPFETPPKYGYVHGTTFPITVQLSVEWIAALDGFGECLSLPHVKGFDQEALRTRIHMFIAFHVIHELVHALICASTEWLPDCNKIWVDAEHKIPGPAPPEPFYRDQRTAELGFALESVLFGGTFNATGLLDKSLSRIALAAPAYGLYIYRFPGWDDLNVTPAESRGSASQYGRSRSYFYPIQMDYLHRFFTEDFWERKVPLYGVKAYHPQRWHGVLFQPRSYNPNEPLVPLSMREPVTPSPPASQMTSPPPGIDHFDPR